jgi:hypothetical protein
LATTRTKAALVADKERGVKLGEPKLAQARKVALEAIGAAADNRAAHVLPIIQGKEGRCGNAARAWRTVVCADSEQRNRSGVNCLVAWSTNA